MDSSPTETSIILVRFQESDSNNLTYNKSGVEKRQNQRLSA